MAQSADEVSETLMKMLEELDKYHIRVLQEKMFRCAAVCCEDKNSSVQNVQSCIRTCAEPLENAEKIVKNEIDHFQNRFQRCIMSCEDTIRDKMGPETKNSEIARYTKELETCAKNCADSHSAIVPDMMKKIKIMLKKEVH